MVDNGILYVSILLMGGMLSMCMGGVSPPSSSFCSIPGLGLCLHQSMLSNYGDSTIAGVLSEFTL